MSAALNAPPAQPCPREAFRHALAQMNVNAPAAPDILLHAAAHIISDPRAGYAALTAFARATVAAAGTASDGGLTPIGEAHCQRIARIIIAEANRRENHA